MLNAVNRLAALITIIEVIVLVVWLRLTATAAAALAAGFLFVGILVEELVRFRGVKNGFPRGCELAVVAVGGGAGTVGWAPRLGLVGRGRVASWTAFVRLDVEDSASTAPPA